MSHGYLTLNGLITLIQNNEDWCSWLIKNYIENIVKKF